jgi:hypothetical protein
MSNKMPENLSEYIIKDIYDKIPNKISKNTLNKMPKNNTK